MKRAGPYEIELNVARALLNEARARRLMGARGFSAMLLWWAGNARRRALAMRRAEAPLIYGARADFIFVDEQAGSP